MSGFTSRTRSLGLALIAAAFVLAGLVVFVMPVHAQNRQPENEDCLVCHDQPSSLHSLPSGELLDVEIDPEAYAASSHGMENILCVECHTDITDDYPHPENPDVQDRRDYVLMYAQTCQECHEDQYEEVADSLHTRVLEAGNKNAPVCSDCHDPHTQPRLTGEDGLILPDRAALAARTCAQCHNAIFEQYENSVHGEGVLVEGNPDTPTCTYCHGVHETINPNTAQFRLQSPDLCAGCHTNEDMMAKYGLSTQVLDTYVSDFHGTTVTLFQSQHPDQPTNKAVCYDCHGVHDIVSVNDPERGIAIKQNMLLACQRCHPDASENFPASWMSHYIATPERNPLVYYVDLFYRIFVPTVLGGMAVFVITDIARKTGLTRRISGLWGKKGTRSGS